MIYSTYISSNRACYITMYHFRIALTISILLTIRNERTTGESIIKPRLSNGLPAGPVQFPWHVKLNIRNRNGLKDCGGAIIDSDWIITSARCLQGATQVNISVGSILYKGKDSKRVNRTAAFFNVHKQWKDGVGSFRNAIGLVKLNQSLNFDVYVRPIKLAQNRSVTDGKPVRISSFGNALNNPQPLSQLQWLNLNINNNQACDKYYNFNMTQDGILCTQNDVPAICWGDEGAPLVNIDGPEPVLVGLAIEGNPLNYVNCNNIEPVIFTNISYFHNWIAQNKRNGATDLGTSLLIVTLSSLLYTIIC